MSLRLLGEQTTLVKASTKFESLRTTVPMSIVKQWKLNEGDKLDWNWEVRKQFRDSLDNLLIS
jgi:hypothetical protein